MAVTVLRFLDIREWAEAAILREKFYESTGHDATEAMRLAAADLEGKFESMHLSIRQYDPKGLEAGVTDAG
jgi:hypothetical protein